MRSSWLQYTEPHSFLDGPTESIPTINISDINKSNGWYSCVKHDSKCAFYRLLKIRLLPII